MRLAATARSIARDLSRLSPDWQNPERYFENRDELRRELLRLANRLDRTHG